MDICLRIGKAETGDSGKVLELSERGKLQKANLEVVLSYGTSLLEVLSRDATTGHEVRRMLALAVLDELIILDRQAATIRFLANHGFLKHLIETLVADEEGLTELLTKPSGNIRSMYVYESKINLLIRVACNPVGAEMLLQAGLMARVAEFRVLDLRPDPDTSLLRDEDADESASSGLNKYHSVLFPVLRLCQAVLASLGSENISAASQVTTDKKDCTIWCLKHVTSIMIRSHPHYCASLYFFWVLLSLLPILFGNILFRNL